MKQQVSFITSQIVYRNRIVNAKIITISSEFDFDATLLFRKQLEKAAAIRTLPPQISAGLQDQDPQNPCWQKAQRYQLNSRLFGAVNLWGAHHIKVVDLDEQKLVKVTEERNNICKIWNHTLSVKNNGTGKAICSNEIILYAGRLTPLYARLLAHVYKKRHRNWALLLNAESR